jgi:serine/threonine-protein kinase
LLKTASLEGMLLDGRYRIGAVIGAGNMSIVREAEDLRLSRPVAVKFIRHGNSDELTERLFREAKAAARTDHPAVVTVFGYGTDDEHGLHYLVMERLHGEDLAARLARVGRMPLSAALRLAAEIADALDYVHRAGVVHRDLKPANVFLARRGLRVDEVKLLDFGVARQLDLQTLTASGEVVGTLAYMAPEQISDPRSVGPHSDVYTLGALLHECLTGRLPYAARSMGDLALRVMRAEDLAIDLSEISAPEAVAELIGCCLRREPARRIASARELCERLLLVGAP